ncbi:NADH dehydrogenase [ubiquinone] 1 alpha subcomplex assembly factor 3 [Paraconiothyrium brasiliense]|uniref:NADH dehydrogenase [ubiquinone] 1 alpha subcomplex assembly factor 3 n=1 Tax=Paraconiothyrium brasiliense TaxID=300254 RepID=A0ABR3QW25_9PLEO
MDQMSIDAFHFDDIAEEDSEEESITSDVLAELDKLGEQLRIHRAPVVQLVEPQRPFPFMRLPLELREQVSEGHVPIVAAGPRADSFTQHRGLVQITAPLHGITVPDHAIIMLLDDVPKFTRVWFYSALNYTNLNPQICLKFTLRDPYHPADPKPAPLDLQRRFLHPFGDVKGLYDTDFEGCHELAVSELRKTMAIPYPTVRESCELATTLMEDGDLLLATNKPKSALDAYIKSFDAIHIKISGRDRRILADGHFADDIREGRYAGQAAMTVRVVLRIRLVARVIHAYIQLGLPNEAAFWGIRSIKLVRQGTSPSADMDDFFADFIGSTDIALMYAWTAAALTLMEDDEKWREEREEYRWEDGGVADKEAMWRRAGLYLASERYASDRKTLVEAMRKFKIRPPAGVFGNEADANLGYLDLGAVQS